MNTHYTRHIIVATLLAFVILFGALSLYRGAEMLTASTAVIAALGILATLELRVGAPKAQKKAKTAKRRAA